MDKCYTSKQMTDAERFELAKKLDEDLDNFINTLEKRQYTDGWPADRWEEEMDKHPFFMKNAPKVGDELSPLMEGLQQLKYDPNENTPEDLANAYKEDGNFNFKHKNYRLAIIAYTEGIKIKCGNDELQATLYNNRSAAHYFLQNYRSSLKDAELALKFKPEYEKASIRAANCYFLMESYENAIKICDELLAKNEANDELLKLRSNAQKANKVKNRNDRKKQLSQSKQMQVEKNVIQAIMNSGIQIGNSTDLWKLEHFEPHIPQLAYNRVHLDENGKLIWPVILSYPEYQIMDFIQKFHEDEIFQLHMYVVLKDFPEWDKDKKYKPSNINLYLETKPSKLCKLNLALTLGEILRLPCCVVKGGTPSFIITAAGSPFETQFLTQYSLESF